MKEKLNLGLDGKNEEYLAKIFAMLRQRDDMIIVDKKTRFNKTELRLISEIVSAKTTGERVISTQLAKRLGVTRSAISQIVNRLETQGVLKRVASPTDKKIAYVELSEGVYETYGKDISCCLRFIGALVEEFGEERFYQMVDLFDEFIDLAAQKMTKIKKEKANCK